VKFFIHETYAYLDLIGYEVKEELPEGWNEMSLENKAEWIRNNGEPYEWHSDALEPLEVTKVEEWIVE